MNIYATKKLKKKNFKIVLTESFFLLPQKFQFQTRNVVIKKKKEKTFSNKDIYKKLDTIDYKIDKNYINLKEDVDKLRTINNNDNNNNYNKYNVENENFNNIQINKSPTKNKENKETNKPSTSSSLDEKLYKENFILLDIEGNINIFKNGSIQTLFNINDINIDKQYLKKGLFSLGYKYHIKYYKGLFAISSDFGVYLITS